jgi:putative ABC transport system permease protein
VLRVAWKGLLGHKLRFALTTLAVVLGVAFVVGSFVFTDTLGRAFDNLFTDAFAGSDVTVRATQELDELVAEPVRLPDDLLDEIEAVEGVDEAWGSVGGVVQVVNQSQPTGGFGPPTLALSWPETDRPGPFELRSGRRPEAPGEVVIDAALASDLDNPTSVELAFGGRPQQWTVVGVAGFGEQDSLGGAGFVLFELGVLQEQLDAVGKLDTIDVAAAPGVPVDELVERIGSVLPEGTEALSSQNVAQEQAAQFQEALGFFNTFLLVFAGISLFVSTFIIQNTFRIVVAQRTQELALLRAVGADGGQVTRMVLTEAAVVGLVASAIGLALGLGLAVAVRWLISGLGVSLPEGDLVVEPRTLLVAAAVGLAVTLISAVLPALRAARVPPVAAMRQAEPSGRESTGRPLVGLGLTLVGAAAVAVGLFVEQEVLTPITLVGAGVAVLFIGLAALSPLLARPAVAVLGGPLGAVSGIPGRLAERNARRSPRRTAATGAALMIGVALVTTSLVLAASFRATINEALEGTFTFDLAVAAAGFGPPTGGLDTTLGDELEALPEVGQLGSVKSSVAQSEDGETLFVAAVDPSLIDMLGVETVEGDLGDLGAGLVAVTEGAGPAMGDTVRLTFPAAGETELEVVAVWQADQIQAEWLLTVAALEELSGVTDDTAIYLRLADGVDAAVGREAVEAVVEGYPQAQVLDQGELRQQAESGVNALLGLIFGLLGLAVIIALFGITNTLSLSVIERTRELGLLRAVGMSRSQVRRMVRWESVIIALFGTLLGAVVGIGFGWAVVRALAEDGLTSFAVPWVQIAMALVVAALAGVIAAIFPARRAARVDVLSAIAYE